MRRLALVLPVLALLASAPSATAEITCSHRDVGPAGPRGNYLVIRAHDIEDQAAIRRRRAAIVVSDDRTGSPVDCSGGTPSVTNLDSIRFHADADGAGLFVSETGGHFAPGATRERDGTSEIEILVINGTAFPGNLGIGGTPGSDSIALGSVGGRARIDLNPGRGSDDPDLFVTRSAPGVVIRAYSGDDRITGGGGRFASSFAPSMSVYAGSGGDLIVGGSGPDLLFGRAGDDRLDGAGGEDDLDCGSGTDDLARAQPGEPTLGCERVIRRP